MSQPSKRKRDVVEKPVRTGTDVTFHVLRPAGGCIKDPGKMAWIQSEIQRLWALPQTYMHNPSPNPVSVESQHLSLLQSNKYVVSLKSDGVRYLLLMSTWPVHLGSMPFAVMIDRAQKSFEVKILAKEDFFSGTLIDGELVLENRSLYNFKRQVYLAFDIVAVCGQAMITSSYHSRLLKLQEVLHLSDDTSMITKASEWQTIAADMAASGKIVSGGNKRALTFRAKGCMGIEELASLWRTKETAGYPVDGLVFTPVHEPIRIGTHTSMFKWKTSHTVDVRIRPGSTPNCTTNRMYLWDDSTDVEVPAETVRMNPNGLRICLVLNQTEDLKTAIKSNPEGFIGECALQVVGNQAQLTLVKPRPDKENPNRTWTVERTIVNLLENINIEQLGSIFRPARDLRS